MQTASLLSIGTELTLGQTVDTNTAWLARQLAALGIRAVRHETVADDLEPIVAAICRGARAADVVLCSGGLGPTDDDLTRQALADAAGCPLVLDERSLEQIRAFFEARGRKMRTANQVQAMVPAKGRLIPNACGTAPGIEVTIEETPVFAMPGVPSEMRAMFAESVVPRLSRGVPSRVLATRTLRSWGLPESLVGERLRDLMVRGGDPEVGTSAQEGEILLRINTHADSSADAARKLDAVEATIRERLESAIFGREDDTLAGAVGALLTAQAATVAVGESCTGGWLGKRLTDTPGSSAYFLGGATTYANTTKSAVLGVSESLLEQHGAVSAPVASAMAEGARRVFGSDYALSTTGVAGPDGGTEEKPVGLVFVGFAEPAGVEARSFRFGSDLSRDQIRLRTIHTALNWLRLHLLKR